MGISVIKNEHLQKNPNFDNPPLTVAADFADTGIGAFRTVQVIGRTLKTVRILEAAKGATPSVKLAELETKFSQGASVLVVPYLIGATKRAIDANAKIGSPSVVPGDVARNKTKAFHDTLEALSGWCFAALLVVKSTVLKNIGGTADLIADATDIHLQSADIKLANQMIKRASTDQTKKALEHTRNHAMLRLAKAVTAVVSGFFGLCILTASLPLICALAFLSLSSTVFAITSAIYKETRPYKLIDFFKPLDTKVV